MVFALFSEMSAGKIALALLALTVLLVILISQVAQAPDDHPTAGGESRTKAAVDTRATTVGQQQRVAAGDGKGEQMTRIPTTDEEDQTKAAEIVAKSRAVGNVEDPAAKSLHEELRKLGTPKCAIDFFEENYASLRRVEVAAKDGKAFDGSQHSLLVSPQKLTKMNSKNTTAIDANDPLLVTRRADAHLASIGISHCYMVHYTPLKKRRWKMAELLSIHGVTVEWMTGFDKEDITADMKSCFHDKWVPTEYSNPKKAARHKSRPISFLRPSQISVVVKHHSVLYDVVRSGHDLALILEDDAFLRAGFRARLAEVVHEMNALSGPKVDVVMIGGCMNMHAYRRKYKNMKKLSKHLYEKQEARCAHAFLVTKEGAKKLLAAIPLTFPIDFQMTAAMGESGLRTLWVEPFLSVQGNIDGCVTNDLGAKCVSIEKYDRAFDIAYVNDSAVLKSWENVPEMGSVK